MAKIKPHGFDNLGAKDKKKDERDFTLGAVKAAAAPSRVYTFPPKFKNEIAWDMPVEYQRHQPACGGHSGATLKGIRDESHYTPRWTWADIKTFDGNALEVGTDLRSIMKSLTGAGPLPFKLLKNDATLPLWAYAHPKVTASMTKEAKKHKGTGYAFSDDLTFNGIKQAIYDHGAVVLLMRVGEEFWTAPNGNTSWAEKDILPLRPIASVVSGHFVVAHSYDENYIYFLNSFSSDWGRDGHGYFGKNYMPWVNDYAALIDLAFSKDLQKGMTDPDVKKLQVLLNKNPKTQVAVSGAGSPGKETDFFGDLTYSAVVRFQSLYSIKPTSGYVGPLTRAVLNGLAG